MNRQVSPPMWANSPSRGPPPPCKEALGWNFFGPITSLHDYFCAIRLMSGLYQAHFPIWV